MITIKIIDLLKNMANGEELPKLIKWRGVEFYLTNKNDYDDYVNDNGCSLFRHDTEFYTSLDLLNDEVEILDEEDEFEDIKLISSICFGDAKDVANLINSINKVIINQRKIIERLKEE